jgi:hypothetical protein
MDIESKRKDSTQLPETKELEAILDKEAKRPVASGKESKHFVSFDLPAKWLELLGLSTDAFRQNLKWQDLVIFGSEIQSQVVSKTLEAVKSGNSELQDLMRKITNYLGEEDTPQLSDSIFVFGSKSLARIETAVSLYNQKLASRVFISGGAPIYERREKSEAQIFKDWALEHGVPENVIAIHDGAISVADNVRGGLNVMDSLQLPHNSLILVTAWFAMRRSWAHTMKYTEEGTKLYRVNAPVTTGGNFTQESWYKNEVGIKTIFNEFGKLRISEALNSS